MTKFLSYLIITVGILAVASWLTATPARADAPVIGEIWFVNHVCREAAIDEVMETVRTKGYEAAKQTFVQNARRSRCHGLTPPTRVRVLSVAEPINTRDGYIVYETQVEGGASLPPGPWFSLHKDKLEGSEI